MFASAVAEVVAHGGAHVESGRRVQAGVVDEAGEQVVDGARLFAHLLVDLGIASGARPGLKRLLRPCQHS